METTPAIEFELSYRLAEYISFVRGILAKRVPELYAEKGKSANRFGLALTRAAVVPILPFVFLYKALRVGRCRFSIDASQIKRVSKAGEIVLAWEKVRSVYSCRPGLLLLGEHGGLPIPDRALNPEQRTALRAFATGHGLVIK